MEPNAAATDGFVQLLDRAFSAWVVAPLEAVIFFDVFFWDPEVKVPLVVLWLVVLYLRRGGELREHTEMLRAQLELLTYPPEDAESRVRVVTDSLRSQAEALDRVTDTATIPFHPKKPAVK